jgi:hypothetical protein
MFCVVTGSSEQLIERGNSPALATTIGCVGSCRRGAKRAKTSGASVTVMIDTRIMEALTDSSMTPSRIPMAEAAIISDNRADSNVPAARLSRQVKLRRNTRAGDSFTKIAATNSSDANLKLGRGMAYLTDRGPHARHFVDKEGSEMLHEEKDQKQYTDQCSASNDNIGACSPIGPRPLRPTMMPASISPTITGKRRRLARKSTSGTLKDRSSTIRSAI